MKGLEEYGFKYIDGRPLEEFDLEFVVENDNLFECKGGILQNCVDYHKILEGLKKSEVDSTES